eukprot:5495302-Lingulodinium_polyedra.AAC.1
MCSTISLAYRAPKHRPHCYPIHVAWDTLPGRATSLTLLATQAEHPTHGAAFNRADQRLGRHLNT